jgi:hypothetical protein
VEPPCDCVHVCVWPVVCAVDCVVCRVVRPPLCAAVAGRLARYGVGLGPGRGGPCREGAGGGVDG